METPFSKEGLASNKPKSDELLPDDHWFSATEKLYENMGEEPSPAQIRTMLAVEAFKLPSGQTSAIETDTDSNRVAQEKDKVIAELFTNKAGVMIDAETGITSCDPRDIYPDGLPAELEKALDPKTVGIINLMYESKTSTHERFGDTGDYVKVEMPFNYFRLLGGVDFFLIGYGHNEDWHKNHQEFLAKIGKFNPAVIGIEGFFDLSPGTSLEAYWKDKKQQPGHYDKLMKQLVENGFAGLFTEVDMRNTSMINMDSKNFFAWKRIFPNLPKEFFQKYFAFLEKEHPWVARTLGSSDGLENALKKQATTDEGLMSSRVEVEYKNGKRYSMHPYLKEDGGVFTVPTGLELGQVLFSDALASIKLHMTARLMADGHIPKGPIVDFEGDNHLPSKAFFVRNLEYAMLIVLRTINELMAGKVEEKSNVEEIYDVFDNPNWTEIVKEIAKLHFSKVDTTKGSSVEIGNDQYPIIKVLVDFLKIYNINPAQVIPSDEEIKAIMRKLA